MIMIVITCVNSQLTFLHTAWSKYWKKNICNININIKVIYE